MIAYWILLLSTLGIIAYEESSLALHKAVLAHDYILVKELLENDYNPNEKNHLLQTPLHIAAHTGDVALTELLIAYGADVEASDIEGSSPLHYAARKDAVAVAELLYNHGADIGRGNAYKVSPMYIACHSGSNTVAEYFISRGASLDEVDLYGASLMVCAVERNTPGNVYIVDLLHGFDVSLNQGDCDGNTPLHAVLATGSYGALLALVALKANPYVVNNKGQTPAEFASSLGYHEIAAALKIYEKHFQASEATLAGQ